MTQSNLLFQVPRAIYSLRQESNIMRQMSQYGCDAKYVNEGEKMHKQVQTLSEQQEEAQRQSREATRSLGETRNFIHTRYMQHLKLSRIAFQNDAKISDLLGFKGPRKMRLDGWLKQTQDFYRHALLHAEALERFGIPRHELEESQILLGQMIELSSLQKQAQSRAQVLTQKKQEALAQLDQWYRKLLKIARVALETEPQQLEALGVAV